MKIYVAKVEVLMKEKRQGGTKFTTKTEMPPPLNVNVFFGNLAQFMIKFRVLGFFFFTL
jgi:hypothetical protein